MRDLFALPCRHGGMGIPIPSVTAHLHYSNSRSISEPLVTLILSQASQFSPELFEHQRQAKSSLHSLNRRLSKDHSILLREKLPTQSQKNNNIIVMYSKHNTVISCILITLQYMYSKHNTVITCIPIIIIIVHVQ